MAAKSENFQKWRTPLDSAWKIITNRCITQNSCFGRHFESKMAAGSENFQKWRTPLDSAWKIITNQCITQNSCFGRHFESKMAAGSENFQKWRTPLDSAWKIVKIEVLLKIHVLAAILNPRWLPEVKIFKKMKDTTWFNVKKHQNQNPSRIETEEAIFSFLTKFTIFHPKYLTQKSKFQKSVKKFSAHALYLSNKTIRTEIGQELREKKHFLVFWQNSLFLTQKWKFQQTSEQVLGRDLSST